MLTFPLLKNKNNVGDHLHFKNGSFRNWRLSSFQPKIAPLITISWQCLSNDEKSLKNSFPRGVKMPRGDANFAALWCRAGPLSILIFKSWQVCISSTSTLELFEKALVDIWIDLYLIKFQFLAILCVFVNSLEEFFITGVQFHQPRLVIRTFHHQGRCSRGGHLCNEHSEEKYSCSYK